MVKVALSIAGSDPSGGAGVQADLKVFHAHGVYGAAAVSLLTVQNTLGVTRVMPVSADFLVAQVTAVCADLAPHALKSSALADAASVRALAEVLRTSPAPLVVDPVLRASSGLALADQRTEVIDALRETLIPIALLVTPNLEEATALSGHEVTDVASAEVAARALCALGAQAVLVKGGHRDGDAIDVLVTRTGDVRRFSAERVATRHTHGTGCTLSAAITARLALGEPLETAVLQAKRWITRCLSTPLGLGHGHGPLNHFVPIEEPR
jgi:hydroxymethylpyrimidine/phosphomethylpyrimidine kinase